MTQQRRFIQCDVFTATPTRGNALAVIVDGIADGVALNKDLLIAQGTNINRHGRVFIKADKSHSDIVRIGGHTHLLIEGTINL